MMMKFCRHCSHHSNEVLLHEVILVIGYFCVLNPDNQVLNVTILVRALVSVLVQVFLQSGRSPTVLQLLCALPLDYFTIPRSGHILLSVLCCGTRMTSNIPRCNRRQI